jgi:hypothetical protein
MEGTLPKSCYEDSNTLIPKLDKDTAERQREKERENYRLISLMNLDAKFFHKILAIGFNNMSKRSNTMMKSVSSQGYRYGST